MSDLQALINLIGGADHYMMPVWAERTEHPRIWKARWPRRVASTDFEEVGFVTAYRSSYGGWSLFHSDTMEKGVQHLASQPMDFEKLRELVHRSKTFRRQFAKALGWCDPGINQWAATNLQGMVANDEVSIKDLWAVVNRPDTTARNSYERRLFELLEGHPELTKDNVAPC